MPEGDFLGEPLGLFFFGAFLGVFFGVFCGGVVGIGGGVVAGAWYLAFGGEGDFFLGRFIFFGDFFGAGDFLGAFGVLGADGVFAGPPPPPPIVRVGAKWLLIGAWKFKLKNESCAP